jgi:hypothetical protein
MKREILIAIGITFLFLGLAIQPSVAVQPETEIDIEPKDYLFQTIIDFANNPDVKELLEQYRYDLFSVELDRSIYRKIFFRNPRLLFNTLFTKPTMSVEYLDNCYNNGIKITNIIGEDKVIETIENVGVTDTKLFDKLDDIISKDVEISSRFETLKEMNKELDYGHYPILCGILILVSLVVLIPFTILGVFIVNSLTLFGDILNLWGIAGLFAQMGMLWLYYGFILFGIFGTLFANLCYIYLST